MTKKIGRFSIYGKALWLCAGSAMAVAGCKPQPPALPIPPSSVATGVLAPCENLTFGGFPRVAPPRSGTFFLCRDKEFVLNYDPSRKTAQWVSEKLTKKNLLSPSVADTKLDKVRPDPLVSDQAKAFTNDYLGTGYTMGFLAPFHDFLYQEKGYSHAHYLTNAIPVHPAAAKAWGVASALARGLALARGEVIVVSAPVYLHGGNFGWIGIPVSQTATGPMAHNGKVAVPTSLLKVIIDPNANQAIAVLIPNNATATTNNFSKWITSLHDLKNKTGVVVAPDLSKNLRDAMFTPIAKNALIKAWITPEVWSYVEKHANDDTPVMWGPRAAKK